MDFDVIIVVFVVLFYRRAKNLKHGYLLSVFGKGSKKMKQEKHLSLSVILEKSTLKRIGVSLSYTLITYLFSQATLIMETYPLASAFFCSCRTNVIFSAVGYIIGAGFSHGFSSGRLLGGVLTVILRYSLQFIRKRRFSPLVVDDTLSMRILSGLLGSFVVSVYRIISGGFLYYDLLASVFLLCSVPLFIWIFSPVFERGNTTVLKYETGCAALIFSLVLSLRGLTFLSFSLAPCCAFFAIFFVSRKHGAIKGAFIGVLASCCLDISLCPMFACIGLLCALLSSYPSYVSVCISSTVGVFCGAFCGGLEVLVTYLPEIGLSSVLYLVAERYISYFSRKSTYTSGAALTDEYTALCTRGESRRNIKRLVVALNDISELLEGLAQRQKRPALHEITDILSNTFAEACQACPKKSSCAACRADYSSFRSIAEQIHERGVFCPDNTVLPLGEVCPRKDIITAGVNIRLSSLTEKKLRGGSLEVMASDYAYAAALTDGCLRRGEESYMPNDEDGQVLLHTLTRLGYEHTSCAVYGTRKRCVISVSHAPDTGIVTDRRLVGEINEALSARFSEPEPSLDGGATVLRMYQKESYKIKCHRISHPRHGEVVNGDSICDILTEDGYGFVMLCDGMGSGSGAYTTSCSSIEFMKKLFLAGCECDGVLKCLNGFIYAANTECFTSADILCVDLLCGNAVFVKCGACPSLVVRGDKIFKLSSHTPPIGIMRELYSEKQSFKLCEGDIIVMMSDGICDWLDEPIFLYEILSKKSILTSEELCREIISAAEEREADDKTVCIIEIVDAE